MPGQEKRKTSATPANKVDSKSSTKTSKSTGCKKSQSRVKPVPDFSKLHNQWSKKLEKQKACCKKPCTVVQEFDFTKAGTKFTLLSGEDLTQQEACNTNPQHQEEHFQADSNALASIVSNTGIAQQRMTGRATIAVNSTQYMRSKSRSKLPRSDFSIPPSKRSKHISQSSSQEKQVGTTDGKQQAKCDKDNESEDPFATLAAQQAEEGLQFEADSSALSSILDHTGVSHTQLVPSLQPSTLRQTIHRVDVEKCPRKSIYRQPEQRSRYNIMADFARLMMKRMTLDAKGQSEQSATSKAAQTPIVSPLFHGTVPRLSLYSCPSKPNTASQPTIAASCPRPVPRSQQGTMGPPAPATSCRKPRRVLIEPSPGKSPALRVTEVSCPQTAPVGLRRRNFLGSNVHNNRHTPRTPGGSSRTENLGLKDNLAKELDFEHLEDETNGSSGHTDNEKVNSHEKMGEAAGPAQKRFAALDTTADLRTLEAIENELEKEIKEMETEDHQRDRLTVATTPEISSAPVSSKKRTPFSVLRPEELLERTRANQRSEDIFLTPHRLHITSEDSTPSPSCKNSSNLVEFESGIYPKPLPLQTISPARKACKNSPKLLPLQSLSPNVTDPKSPRTPHKGSPFQIFDKNSNLNGEKIELFKVISPYRAQVWSVMDIKEKENVSPLMQCLSKSGQSPCFTVDKENMSPLIFRDIGDKNDLTEMIKEVKQKGTRREKLSPLIFDNLETNEIKKPEAKESKDTLPKNPGNHKSDIAELHLGDGSVCDENCRTQTISSVTRAEQNSEDVPVIAPAVWERVAQEECMEKKKAVMPQDSLDIAVESVTVWEPSKVNNKTGPRGHQATNLCRPGRRSAFTAPCIAQPIAVMPSTCSKAEEEMLSFTSPSGESNEESTLSDTTFTPPLYGINSPEMTSGHTGITHDTSSVSHLSGLGQVCRTFGSPIVVTPHRIAAPVASFGSLSLAANVSVASSTSEWTVEPKTQLLATTAQRYRDALLDEEVALYTCRLPLKMRNKMNAERPSDPLAYLLWHGDDRHFIPISVIEDDSWLKRATHPAADRVPGSAFSRYNSTPRLTTLV